MNLILTYLIDLSKIHKHSVSLFLICLYPGRYNAYLRFKCYARWTLLHRSLIVKVSIGYIFIVSYLIIFSFIFVYLNITFYLYFSLGFLLVSLSDLKNRYKLKKIFEVLIH